ncbi:hypothetical protein GJAV_G00228470 [Gymnothorax javanicus]|nr:hypothetical protein GJAV_G00228470 [Gymnothorax javanicus]
MSEIDTEGIRELYELVRDDNSDINWMTIVYDGKNMVAGEKGVEYEEFKQQCTDDERVFGYVRVTTGDDMSKRFKFALITWIGTGVSVLKRAKVSTDKAFVKEIVKSFAKEFMVTERRDLDEDHIREGLKKAGGANYDAQAE